MFFWFQLLALSGTWILTYSNNFTTSHSHKLLVSLLSYHLKPLIRVIFRWSLPYNLFCITRSVFFTCLSPCYVEFSLIFFWITKLPKKIKSNERLKVEKELESKNYESVLSMEQCKILDIVRWLEGTFKLKP